MKTHKTKKMQRAGLQAPVVYSHPDNDIHKQWFDLFMKNIDEVKKIGDGAYGVAVLVTSYSSPYKKNGKVVNKILLKLWKMEIVKMLEKRFENAFNNGQMTQDDVNDAIKRMGSFEKEVETQNEFYSKTISKSLDDSLCPKIVYSSEEYYPNDTILTFLKHFMFDNILDEGKTKIIAMEFMDSYETLETIFEVATFEQKCLYLAMTMYTFIRFTYLTGKRHGDEHFRNIMIDTNANYFPGKNGKVILIDFGSSKDMDPLKLQDFFNSYKLQDVEKLISILNLFVLTQLYNDMSLFNKLSLFLTKKELVDMANNFWTTNKSFVKKLRLLNKPFLQNTIDNILETLSNEQTDTNNNITLQQLLDDSSLDLPDSLKTEILNNTNLSNVLEIILKTKVKRPDDSLNLTGVILTDIEEKILELVTREQLIELLSEISDKFESHYLSNLKKKYGDFSYVPLYDKVKELMVLRKNFDSTEVSTTPYSEISANTPNLDTPNSEITDEKCRKKCGWSFNKTKCLTKCKTNLKKVEDDLRLIGVATKNRRLCESNGYNCWSRRNFTPNQCKKKCAISLRNLNKSTKIEPTLEYAKFIAHLYSKNSTFLCNKLFVQYIENSVSIKELIDLLNRRNAVLKHEDYLELNKLIGEFNPKENSDNIEDLKQNIERAKKSIDCVNSVKPVMENLKEDSTESGTVENLVEGLDTLNIGGFKSKKRKGKRKRKTKRFSNK